MKYHVNSLTAHPAPPRSNLVCNRNVFERCSVSECSPFYSTLIELTLCVYYFSLCCFCFLLRLFCRCFFSSFSHCVYATCLDLTIKLGWCDLFSMLSLLLYSCYVVLFCDRERMRVLSFILVVCVYVKHVNQLYCMA